MSTPLVSICIPCLNSGRWLRESVQSALDQTWKNKEILVLDNGSTDDSIAVAESFGDSVRLFHTELRGAPHARNLGLKEARGEWVQFLDADDFLLPGKISNQLGPVVMGDSLPDMIYSPVLVENMNDSTRIAGAFTPEYDPYSLWISWEMPQTGGALWRRDPLRAIGGWNEAMPCCQEHELYFRAFRNGLSMLAKPSLTEAVYRIWSEETLCRKDPCLVVRVRTRLIDEFRAWLTEKGLWNDQHEFVAGRACFEMARTLARFDIAQADAYHADRKKAGLFEAVGPAAPATYLAAYTILGFRRAEELAKTLRR